MQVPAPVPPVGKSLLELWAIYLTVTCVGSGLLAIVARWFVLRKRKIADFQLDAVINAFYSGATIPVGLFLIVAAFKPSLMTYLHDLNLALTAAGVSSVYLAYKALFRD